MTEWVSSHLDQFLVVQLYRAISFVQVHHLCCSYCQSCPIAAALPVLRCPPRSGLRCAWPQSAATPPLTPMQLGGSLSSPISPRILLLHQRLLPLLEYTRRMSPPTARPPRRLACPARRPHPQPSASLGNPRQQLQPLQHSGHPGTRSHCQPTQECRVLLPDYAPTEHCEPGPGRRAHLHFIAEKFQTVS